MALLALESLGFTTVDGFSADLGSVVPWGREVSMGGSISSWQVCLVYSLQTPWEDSLRRLHASGKHFDVVSLGLFIDVGRFAEPLSYLVAKWVVQRQLSNQRAGTCLRFGA